MPKPAFPRYDPKSDASRDGTADECRNPRKFATSLQYCAVWCVDSESDRVTLEFDAGMRYRDAGVTYVVSKADYSVLERKD